MDSKKISGEISELDHIRILVNEAEKRLRLPLFVLLAVYTASSFALLVLIFFFSGLDLVFWGGGWAAFLGLIPALSLLFGWIILGLTLHRFMLLFRRETNILRRQRAFAGKKQGLPIASDELDHLVSKTEFTMTQSGKQLQTVIQFLVIYWVSIITIAILFMILASFRFLY